jgi:hypothetical protein
MSALTTIPLRQLGKKGETYEVVVVRLMEQAELAGHLETHYERLRDKSKFIPLDEI